MISQNPAHQTTEAGPPAVQWNGRGVVGWIVLAFVFATGCWIRWKIATGELLWLDELHTGWAVGGTFEKTLTRSAQGNQAPLFFGLVWSVVQWLGSSELSLRLVSLIAGVTAMGLAGRFVWLQTKSIAAATVTLTLIAIDDNFIWYATEARPYALLHLASVIQAACFWQSVQRWMNMTTSEPTSTPGSWPSTCALLLSSWAVVYTHYTGVFLLAAEVMFVVALLLGRYLTGRSVKEILTTVVLFTAGCLPLLLLINQAFGKPADWSSVAKLDNFLAEQTVNGIRWFAIPLVAVGLSTVIALLLKRQPKLIANKPDHLPNTWWLSWIAVWFFVPLLTIVALQTQAGIPIALSRYLSVAIIAGPIFAGTLVGNCDAQSRWIVIPAILLASIYAQLHVQNNQAPNQPPLPLRYRVVESIVRDRQLPLLRSENWKSPIEVINNHTDRQKWPLFLFGAVIEDASALTDTNPEFQSYLQFPIQSLYRVEPDARVLFAGPTIQHQHFDDRYLDELVGQGGAWILVRHVPQLTQEIANELERRIRSQLDNSNTPIEINWFGNRDNVVHLISIQIKQ